MNVMNLLKRLSSGIEGEYRIFYWIMTLILVWMYVSAVITNQALHQIGPLVLFTLLMNLHIGLHWALAAIQERGWTWAYVVLQGGLGYWLVLLSGNLGMTFAVFMGLIGEIFGLLIVKREAWIAAAFYMTLSLAGFTHYLGLASAFWWVLGTLPMVLFTVIYTILYRRQADAREHAQILLAELETANRQLSEYAAQVEDLTIAAERQRMARELHDTLSQGLAGLILQLEAVDAHLGGGRVERGRMILEQSKQKARASLSDARRAIDDLRKPPGRDLAEAVREEAARFAAASGISCETDLSLPAVLPEPVGEAAVRVVAEGLTNVARHARAKSVSLRKDTNLEVEELRIEISDDGIGFDPEAVAAGHYGLLGMRERVRLAGGRLEVRSAPGEGTCLRVHFPLEGMRG